MKKDYIKSIKYPFRAKSFRKTRGMCDACGEKDATFEYFDVINDRLAKEWEINERLKKAYSQRESMHCSKCRCSARLRAQAKALAMISGSDVSLLESISDGIFKDKKIAEINACGDLHHILLKIDGLQYSEYAPKDKKIQHQDLQKLSYEDETFDIVLTSDTLEHVPDYRKAFSEIRRVLKDGGYHIFTIPLIFSRNSRRRVELKDNGEMGQILEESYHGAGEPDNLVTTEFGIDLLRELKELGFKTEIYFGNPINLNEVNYVLVSRKV